MKLFDVVGVYWDEQEKNSKVTIIKECSKCGKLYISSHFEGETIEEAIAYKFPCLKCFVEDNPDKVHNIFQ